jgi:hypothetical protein
MSRNPSPHQPDYLAVTARFHDDLATYLVDAGTHRKKAARRAATLANRYRRLLDHHGPDGTFLFVEEPERHVDRLDRLAVVRLVELAAGAPFAPLDPVLANLVAPATKRGSVRPMTELELATALLVPRVAGWRADTARRRTVMLHLMAAGASAAECARLRPTDVRPAKKGAAYDVDLPGTTGKREDARHRAPRTVRLDGPSALELRELLATAPTPWLLCAGSKAAAPGRESALAVAVRETLKWSGAGWDTTARAMSLSYSAARLAGKKAGVEAAAGVLGSSDFTRVADQVRLYDPAWDPA